MMSTLLKLGLSGYDVKPRLKIFGGTRHPCEKNEHTLDQSGGGVHGKACWHIAYCVYSVYRLHALEHTGKEINALCKYVYKTRHSCFSIYYYVSYHNNQTL